MLEYYETTLAAEGESLTRRGQLDLLALAQQLQPNAAKLRAFPLLVEALESIDTALRFRAWADDDFDDAEETVEEFDLLLPKIATALDLAREASE